METNGNGVKMYTPDTFLTKTKEKSENILVFARVRPVNNHERSKNALTVLDCPGTREVVVRERGSAGTSKTFTFDRVFGPHSKQLDVYKAVVSPLLEEVLLGYNCTVFAYGQTGTGKTFTMEGERSTDGTNTWESDPLAGIVPRAMSQLFDELRVANSEYTVRVSLVEMYNEEVYCLLSATEDGKPKTVRLFEDTSRKGSVHINGLEEVIVHNKHEVYGILERGSQMRKTASTLLNANSSRSHTVFTVTVHLKEASLLGDDLVKIGKLHLVDLAGSENIGRSGAVDKRAREAGNINQSLLTLGRVITALVERAPHVPYRESKLTRLLQDSLGGKTKTSIIATVSPASINIEETLSTLDYAHRAKNIQNRPEVNQKLTKKAMMREYTEEIERLRKDLLAAREKNGIYVDKDNYDTMMSQIESQGQDLSDKIQYTRNLEEQIGNKETELNEVKAVLVETKEDLDTANAVIASLNNKVAGLTQKLQDTENQKEEFQHLVQVHTDTETKLTTEAKTLLNTVTDSTVNLESLHSRLERKKNVEAQNLEAGKRFHTDFDAQLRNLAGDVKAFRQEHTNFSAEQRLTLDGFLERKEQSLAKLEENLVEFTSCVTDLLENLKFTSGENFQKQIDLGQFLLTETSKFSMSGSQTLDKFINEIVLPQTADLSNQIQKVQTEIHSLIGNLKQNVRQEESMVNDFAAARLNRIETQINDLRSLKNSNDEIFLEYTKKKQEIKNFNAAQVKDIKSTHSSAMKLMQKLMSQVEGWSQISGQNNEETSNLMEKAKSVNLIRSENALTALSEEESEVNLFKTAVAEVSRTTLSELDIKDKLLGSMQQTTEYSVSKIDDDLKKTLVETGRIWKQGEDSVRSSFDQQLVQLMNQNGVVKDMNKNIAKYHEERVSDIKTNLSEEFKEDQSFTEAGKQNLFDHCDFVSQKTDEFHHRLHMQSGRLNEFWDSTYLVDLPTGATPQRKAYDFPTTLSATSPHKRILERFRTFKFRLEAADTSSPDSSKIITPRDDNSPQSSSGPDTPNFEEELSSRDDNKENPQEIYTPASVHISKVQEKNADIMGPPSSNTGSKGIKGSNQSIPDAGNNSQLKVNGKGTSSNKRGPQDSKRFNADKKAPSGKGKKVLSTPNRPN